MAAAGRFQPLGREAIAWLMAGMWLFLVMQDTIGRGLIPAASLLRLFVPLALCVLMLLAPKRGRSPTEGVLTACIFLLAIGGALSSVASVSPYLGLVKLALYLAVLIPLLSTSTIFESIGPHSVGCWRFTQVLAVVLAACLGLCLVGSSRGIFLNPNGMGLFAVAVAPWMLFHSRHPLPSRKSLGRFGLAAVILLVLLSRSRGAVGGMVVLLVAHAALKRSPSLRSLLLLGGLVFMVGGMLAMGSEWIQEFLYKGDAALIDSARRTMAEETWRYFQERPLLGFGFGMSWLVTAENAMSALMTGRLSLIAGEFGNSTLAMVAGGGLAVVIPFFAIFGIVLSRGIGALRAYHGQWPASDFQLAIVSGIFGLLVNAQAEAWLMAPLSWAAVMFWLYCGLALHTASLPAAATVRRPPAQTSPQTLFPTRPDWNRGPFQPL